MTSGTDQNAHIPNAEAIIERFGGIRPMASKVIIPVTTIQGWKKRNVIPANRKTQILEAADRHGIDLGTLLDTIIETLSETKANASTEPADVAEAAPHPNLQDPAPVISHVEEQSVRVTVAPSSAPPVADVKNTASIAPVRYGRRKSDRYAHAVWYGVMILALAILVGLLAMGPGVTRIVKQEQRLQAMETQLRQVDEQIQVVQTENALLQGLIPEDLKTQISGLQDRAAQIESTVMGIGTQAKEIVNSVMGTESESITERLARVEREIKRFAELTGSTELTAFVVRLQNLQASEDGKQILKMARAQLLGALEAANPKDNNEIKKTLELAAKTNEAFRTTMDGLKGDDLKAASMLMALTQYRSSLMRDNVPFDQDLKIMRDLVGTDNPELLAAIDRLAPQAKSGVLTPKGLSEQFRGLSGEIITASLSGEDVSVSERLKARLHEVMKIERNGEPLTGTPTQQAVTVAQARLDQNDVPGALNVLEALDGKAAAAASNWVKAAEQTINAQKVRDLFTKTLSARISIQPITNQLGSLQGAGLNVQGLTNQLVQSLSMGARP